MFWPDAFTGSWKPEARSRKSEDRRREQRAGSPHLEGPAINSSSTIELPMTAAFCYTQVEVFLARYSPGVNFHQSPPSMPTSWKVAGSYFESCNCEVACPCVFMSPPTSGECTVLVAWHIEQGRFGEVDLDGLNAVLAAH